MLERNPARVGRLAILLTSSWVFILFQSQTQTTTQSGSLQPSMVALFVDEYLQLRLLRRWFIESLFRGTVASTFLSFQAAVEKRRLQCLFSFWGSFANFQFHDESSSSSHRPCNNDRFLDLEFSVFDVSLRFAEGSSISMSTIV